MFLISEPESPKEESFNDYDFDTGDIATPHTNIILRETRVVKVVITQGDKDALWVILKQDENFHPMLIGKLTDFTITVGHDMEDSLKDVVGLNNADAIQVVRQIVDEIKEYSSEMLSSEDWKNLKDELKEKISKDDEASGNLYPVRYFPPH